MTNETLRLTPRRVYHSIAKSTGYKTSDLDELAEGSTLVIGGKEIEVKVQRVATNQ